jgi:hypothetical protein
VRYEDFIGHSTALCVKIFSFFFDLPADETDTLLAVLSPPHAKKISSQSRVDPQETLDQFLESHPTSEIVYEV